MDLFSLTGKKALVTGASRGLGQSMAAGLLKAGAEVVLLDVRDEVEQTAAMFQQQGYKVTALKVDLMDRSARIEAFGLALEKLGGSLDILINNAGIHDRRSCLDLTIESWDRVIELNISAVFHLCKLAGEVMIRQRSGKIISTASMLSFTGGYNATAYAVSKGGIAQLTKSLSNEWASRGISVNAIAPGYMDTHMNDDLKLDEKRLEHVSARIPAGRWGKPEDLEGTVIFLASRASDYITGAIIPVDGGYLGR